MTLCLLFCPYRLPAFFAIPVCLLFLVSCLPVLFIFKNIISRRHPGGWK